MTRPTFTEALKSRPWLLADGATGTNYFQMGLVSGGGGFRQRCW